MNEPDRVVLVLPGTSHAHRTLRAAAERFGFRRFARHGTKGWRIDGLPGRWGDRAISTEADLRATTRPGAMPSVLSWTGDRVIPLENLLAKARGDHPVVVRVRSVAEVPATLGALERGADVAIVEVREMSQLRQLYDLLDLAVAPLPPWRRARLARIEPAGTSERVLVDTTRTLSSREGLLVGSAAGFLFGVASEAQGSEFSAPRPFRVNAGSPHSYVLMADGTTRYLSELRPGDRVMVAGAGIAPSVARVGRIKQERRPMLLVEATVARRSYTLFLQEAESVRVLTPAGSRPVHRLRPGRPILGVALPPARHLGTAIDETVEER